MILKVKVQNVIYKEEIHRAYDENAIISIIFAKTWNDSIDIVNKWSNNTKRGIQQPVFNLFLSHITTFTPEKVCLHFFLHYKYWINWTGWIGLIYFVLDLCHFFFLIEIAMNKQRYE